MPQLELNNDSMMYQEIGLRVKRLREHKGFTQRQLAALLECNNTEIADLEQGKLEDIHSHLFLLHEQLGIDLNWIITGDNKTYIYQLIEKPEDVEASDLCLYFGLRYKSEYDDLLKLLQVPEVDQVIMAKFAHLKIMCDRGLFEQPGESAAKPH